MPSHCISMCFDDLRNLPISWYLWNFYFGNDCVVFFDCQLGRVCMWRESPLLDVYVELQGKRKERKPQSPKNKPHNGNQSLKVALGSQVFFSPEEAAAALSRGWEQSGYLVSVCMVLPASTAGWWRVEIIWHWQLYFDRTTGVQRSRAEL